jgi:tetratricopeptide (TPR) repeat protein
LADVERLSGELNRWPNFVEVVRAAAESAFDFDLAASLFGKVAVAQEDRLRDPDGAISSWRQAMLAKEDDYEIVDNLCRLLEERERYAELVQIIPRKIELSSDAEFRLQLYRQAAEISQVELGDREKAIENWRQVLSLNDCHHVALDALEQLYRLGDNYLELLGILRRKIELAEHPSDRREFYLESARICERQLVDPFEAIAAYKEVLALDDRDADALEALDRLYAKEGLWQDLLEIVRLKVARETELDAINALRFRSGAILANEIGDLEAAMDQLELLGQSDPAHEPTREFLERLLRGDDHLERVATILVVLYRQTNDLSALVRVLERRLAWSEGEDARDLLLEIARLREDGLDDRRGAFDAYGRALVHDAASEAIQANLERLARELSILPELATLYEERLETIYDNDCKRALALKLARMLEEDLGSDERAEEHYRRALDCEGDPLPPIRALHRLLERHGKWIELLDVLEQETAAVLDQNEQAALYCRIGQIRQREQADLDGAFMAYREALERNRQSAQAIEGLDQLLAHEALRNMVLELLDPLHADMGNWRRVVELKSLRAASLGDSRERAQVLVAIAQLQLDRLDDPTAALVSLGSALREDPRSDRVLEEAERVSALVGDFRPLAEVVEKVLAVEDSADVVERLGGDLGRWCLGPLRDVGRAERAFLRVLATCPESTEAFGALDGIYRGGRHQDLADLLARRAEVENDYLRKCRIYREVAQIRDDLLGDDEGAIQAWKALLEVDETDIEAIRALSKIYERRRSWEDVLDLLDREGRYSADGGEQALLKHRAAHILRSEVGDRVRAADLYREVLDLRPGDDAALGALEELYREGEDWASVQEVLVRRLDHGATVEVLLRLADLCQDKLKEPEEAIGHYQQILAGEPDHALAFERLEALLRSETRWHDLVDLQRGAAMRLERRGEQKEAINRLAQVARIWLESLQDVDAAAEVLEEIRARDPENVHVLTELARLYEVTEQWGRCEDTLRQAAGLGPSSSREAAEIEFRLGRVAALQSGNDAEAAHQSRKSLELNTEHLDAQAGIESVARADGDWESLARALERRVRRAPAEDQQRIYQELGQLYLERLELPELGVDALTAASRIVPDDVEVLRKLAGALTAAGRLDQAEPILHRLVEQAGRKRGKELAGYHLQLGVIAKKRGRLAEARQQFEKARTIDSTNAKALAALGEAYLALEDWNAARGVYRSMLLQNLEGAGVRKAEIFLNLGRVHEALGERAKAISMFERGLVLEPDHGELAQAIVRAKE